MGPREDEGPVLNAPEEFDDPHDRDRHFAKAASTSATLATARAAEVGPLAPLRQRTGPDRHRLNRDDMERVIKAGESVLVTLPDGTSKVVSRVADLPSDAELVESGFADREATLRGLAERKRMIEEQERRIHAATPTRTEPKAEAGGEGKGDRPQSAPSHQSPHGGAAERGRGK